MSLTVCGERLHYETFQGMRVFRLDGAGRRRYRHRCPACDVYGVGDGRRLRCREALDRDARRRREAGVG